MTLTKIKNQCKLSNNINNLWKRGDINLFFIEIE
jgi:hypothetical protein